MAAFIVVYIQLTALQVGAKYRARGLMSINEFYRKQIKELKAKVIAHGKLGNELKVSLLNKEIGNYERALRANTPKGVDSYLS